MVLIVDTTFSTSVCNANRWRTHFARTKIQLYYSCNYKGCGPVNSTDLALGLANERREKLSEADKREQMRIALSIETGTGESGRGDRIVSRGLGERWPNGVVPYILSCSYDEKDRGVIATAIDNIEKNSCVRFRGATVEDKDYVTINNTETGCFVRGRG